VSAQIVGSLDDVPEFLNPKLLQLLPKLSKRELGSIVLISFSIKVRTLTIHQHSSRRITYSSLILSSSVVGKRGRTKENREVERSVRKRRCSAGCMMVIYAMR
jgi:hypothetical protein